MAFEKAHGTQGFQTEHAKRTLVFRIRLGIRFCVGRSRREPQSQRPDGSAIVALRALPGEACVTGRRRCPSLCACCLVLGLLGRCCVCRWFLAFDLGVAVFWRILDGLWRIDSAGCRWMRDYSAHSPASLLPPFCCWLLRLSRRDTDIRQIPRARLSSAGPSGHSKAYPSNPVPLSVKTCTALPSQRARERDREKERKRERREKERERERARETERDRERDK